MHVIVAIKTFTHGNKKKKLFFSGYTIKKINWNERKGPRSFVLVVYVRSKINYTGGVCVCDRNCVEPPCFLHTDTHTHIDQERT